MQKFFIWQRKLSRAFDSLLPAHLTVDGNNYFRTETLPRFLKPDLTVVDIGGGKQPALSEQVKSSLKLRIIGIDIDESELLRAPAGVYDTVVVADITSYTGDCSGDLVICQALLEHVKSSAAALTSIASTLKPGGTALIFVPSKNALFARLNLLIPETLKRQVLFYIFPESSKAQGFKAYYDNCTPAQLTKAAQTAGFEIVETRLFFMSAYFTFFVPLHILWRCWNLLLYAINRELAAETFCLVLRKDLVLSKSRVSDRKME